MLDCCDGLILNIWFFFSINIARCQLSHKIEPFSMDSFIRFRCVTHINAWALRFFFFFLQQFIYLLYLNNDRRSREAHWTVFLWVAGEYAIYVWKLSKQDDEARGKLLFCLPLWEEPSGRCDFSTSSSSSSTPSFDKHWIFTQSRKMSSNRAASEWVRASKQPIPEIYER